MWELFWVPCLVEILKRVAFQWRQRQIDAWPSVSRVNSWRSWTYYQYWLSRWIWLSTWASIAGELPLAFSEFFLDVPSSTFPRERMEHVGICLPPHYSCHLPSRHRREQCYWSAVCGRHSLFASIVRVPAVALALFFFFFCFSDKLSYTQELNHACIYELTVLTARSLGTLGAPSRLKCWQGSVSF